MKTPLERAKSEMKSVAKEQGGTCSETGMGNAFKGCQSTGKYTGHKSASSGGVAGNETAMGSASKGVGK